MAATTYNNIPDTIKSISNEKSVEKSLEAWAKEKAYYSADELLIFLVTSRHQSLTFSRLVKKLIFFLRLGNWVHNSQTWVGFNFCIRTIENFKGSSSSTSFMAHRSRTVPVRRFLNRVVDYKVKILRWDEHLRKKLSTGSSRFTVHTYLFFSSLLWNDEAWSINKG